ncbi:HET domain-containing protein [Fusarium sp. LHS14.1]|nr:HET domain-containing protein [Fusarium sp. LHS14.1]
MDDKGLVAAREYPGCFTDNEVRQYLGQPSRDAPNHEDQLQCEGRDVTPENHWLRDCLCAPFHVRCAGPGSACSLETKDGSTAMNEAPINQNTGADTPFSPVDIRTTLDELRTASESTCWFCAVLYANISSSPSWDPTVPLPSRRDIKIESKKDGLYLTLDDNYRQILLEPEMILYTDCAIAFSSPCQALPVQQQRVYTKPQAQIAFASGALKRCIETHACAPRLPSFMPTRLIHVQVVGGNHCWGPEFPSYARTTALNIDSRLSASGIPWAELPQSLRDAVAVTERLGFNYIWIDALCIIQGLSTDWLTESSLMHQVYSHCDLMLSADASPDTNVGLFRPSNMARPWSVAAAPSPLLWKGCSVKACYGLVHQTYYETNKGAIYFSRPHVFPLSTRAWCYQEEQVARQIVHFSIDEVSYECLDSVECHCGFWGPEGRSFDENIWRKTLPYKACTEEEKHRLWRDIVERYSERQLSFWSDRLPALSALARQFQVSNRIESGRPSASEDEKRMFNQIDMGTYLAGLWSNFLQTDLFWLVGGLDSGFVSGEHGRRISNCVAPTWSWASVCGRILWGDLRIFLADILSVRCSPVGSDELGMITSAELVLRAKTIPVCLTQEFFKVFSGRNYWTITLESQDPATGEHTRLVAFQPDYVQPTPEAEFLPGVIPRVALPDLPPEKLIPVKDAEYLAMQIGSQATIIVKVVEIGEPLVCEHVGIVHRNLELEFDDNTRWFDGAKPRVLKII